MFHCETALHRQAVLLSVRQQLELLFGRFLDTASALKGTFKPRFRAQKSQLFARWGKYGGSELRLTPDRKPFQDSIKGGPGSLGHNGGYAVTAACAYSNIIFLLGGNKIA